MSRNKSGRLVRPRSKPVPDDFECIAPEESLIVFDFLRGRDDVDKRLAAIHVNLCAQCYETVMNLKDIDEARKEQLVVV